MAADHIEELVGRCLIHVLDAQGHGLYLRHPQTREVVLVAWSSERSRVDADMRKIRRIVLGLAEEIARETLRQ